MVLRSLMRSRRVVVGWWQCECLSSRSTCCAKPNRGPGRNVGRGSICEGDDGDEGGGQRGVHAMAAVVEGGVALEGGDAAAQHGGGGCRRRQTDRVWCTHA